LDGKEYQIDTNFKNVWFTDNEKQKLNFDINEQIKIGQKSYDAVIYDSYIALIDNDTNEIIPVLKKETFKPQHTFGEIQIGRESYRIIEDNDAIRYLVDKTGNTYLY